MAYRDIAPSIALRAGKPLTEYIDGIDLAIFRIGSELFATDRWCPHARGDLSDGDLDGCRLTCPDHKWSFDVRSGNCLKESGGRELATYAVREREGRIEVDLPTPED